MIHGIQFTTLVVLLASAANTIVGQPLGSTSKLCKSIHISSGEYYQHRNMTRLYKEWTNHVGGCEYVHGDVTIMNVGADPNTEVSIGDEFRSIETNFLDSIVEITGKLEIMRVNLKTITFKNLRAIRGYNPENKQPFYAIDILQSKFPTNLKLPRLSAILQHNVRIIGNLNAQLYCYLSRRISWASLFQNADQRFLDEVRTMTFGEELLDVSNYQVAEQTCSSLNKCHSSCHTEMSGRQLCWSNGPDGCQGYHRCKTRTCFSGLCFHNRDTGDENCCQSECLGGCISERPDGCFSCKHVSLDGTCHNTCPRKEEYDPGSGQMKPSNSSIKRLGNICMNQCVMPFVQSSDGEFCLSKCRDTEIPLNGVCIGCAARNQASCIKCVVDEPILTDARAKELKDGNCTIWETTSSLDVDIQSLNNATSLEAFEHLQFFYGKLFIKRAEKLTENLRFLRSLKFVSGKFQIMMMRTQYLGLKNLRFAESLLFREITGLCSAWFPTKWVDELKKTFRINMRNVQFDNSSIECQKAACDPLCMDECWGPGPDMCVKCRHFNVNGRCYATCQDADSYQKNGTCEPCNAQCSGGCTGSKATDCKNCRNLSEYDACVATCSPEMRPDSQGRCYSIASARLKHVGIGVGLLVVVLLILLTLAFVYYRRRMQEQVFVDIDEILSDPKNPNDMAKLLIVNDDDVVKQKEIGSGAFGTVFKGILRSSTVKGIRELPVAIKVLRGCSPKLGQELLNEASVLARVRHPCCIRLVALCLTQEPQLITSLMPRGCLLEFVRTHHNRIGAERILQWGRQVAEGMEYLESLGIVHRDLAARNVLLQTPDQVRITDFGLARLLDIAEGEFIQTAGLLPVKWLGVECFESGLFSHKSDVWSYGVLLWEICTFGESPYNPYGIRSVEDITGLLKKGIRLNQPDICSIDFYNILLGCWLPNPESRPSFTDLVTTMDECLLNPSKYIAASYSTADAFDPEEIPVVEPELKKPSLGKAQAKHQELNAYISDPTRKHPMLRHPPKGSANTVVSPSEVSVLLRTLSNEDADGYLAPNSPSNFDGSSGSHGLEDYLAPVKS